MSERKLSTRKLIMVALLGAVAAVLMSLEISIPFIPGFIKMDLSEVPIILGGLSMGFSYGLLVCLIKVILKVLISGTNTMFLGELVNIIISLLYLIPFCLLLKKHKENRNLIVSLIIATVMCSIMTAFANLILTFPMYAKLYGLDMPTLIAMFSAVNPLVKNTFTMVIFSIVPFNLIKYGINSFCAYLIYQRIPQLKEL